MPTLCSKKRNSFLSLLLVSLLAARAYADDWDELDEPLQPVAKRTVQAEQPTPEQLPEEPQTAQSSLRSRSLPVAMAIFLGSSMVALILGGRANAKRTLAFEEQFCSEPEGILRKQFTRLGKGSDKLLVTENSSTFKLHANGHLHLYGAVITLTLLRRHEMVSYIAQKVVQQEDVVCFELYVKEGCMPPMVLAIATPATHKELLRNYRELKLLAPRLEVKDEKLRDWPKDNLFVYAEHPSYFYDMMTKPMLAQVFGGVAFPKHRKYFRGLQITSESFTSHQKVIRLWLALPAAEHMEELLTLMQAVFAMVSQVANYSISPERQKQAEQARQQYAKKLGRTEPNAFAKENEIKTAKQKRK